MRPPVLAGVTAAGLVLVLAAGPAAAEVRLHWTGRQGPEVRIITTDSGPWTPVSRMDRLQLNALGDLRGDGIPTWVRSGGAVLTAWSTGGDEPALALATGRREWLGEGVVTGARPQGGPRVAAASAAAWVLAWQECEDGPGVRVAAAVEPVQVSESVALPGAAWLVDVVAVDSTTHVVTLDASGQLGVTSAWPAGEAADTDLGLEVGTRHEIVLVSVPEPLPMPWLHAPSPGPWRLGSAPHAPVDQPLSTCVPPVAPEALRLQLHDVKGRPGVAPRRVLTWWIHPWALGHVEMDADGPAGEANVVAAPRGVPYSPTLVQHALRQYLD